MNEKNGAAHTRKSIGQATPCAVAGEASLAVSWVQGNKMNDIYELLKEYEPLLTEWGFSMEDVMALAISRAYAKPGDGLWLLAECGGQVHITPLGLS